jgi:periplasmic protein TonB
MAAATIAEHAALHAPLPQTSKPGDPPRKPSKTYAAHRTAAEAGFLSDALLENNHLDTSKKSKALDLLLVIFLHVALVGGSILVGLYFSDTLNLKAYYATLLVTPPPPPPPPAAPAIAQLRSAPPHRVFMQQGKLLAPTYVPKQVAQLREAAEPELDGVEGGVPGGVPGGQMGGVIGGIISGSKTNVPAPLATAMGTVKAPIRVGGKVKPPKPIYMPTPIYPVLAKQTHVRGVVQIDAVLDTDGTVSEMKVVSGHPLLIQAAIDAVRTWKYEPSYLNGQPIAVELIVNVSFELQQ